MEREHLIIIALILVALYMMNKDTKDTVMSMGPVGPMGRIRYTDCSQDLTQFGCSPLGHIRTREGYVIEGAPEASAGQPQRIRYSDKDFSNSQHIKNHIRNRNMNSMFNGMMGTCEGQDCYGQ